MKKLILTLGIALASYSSLFAQWQNGTDIYNTNTGNVGIGTAAPAATLDVLKSGGDAIQIKTAETNPSRLAFGYDSGSTSIYITSTQSGTGTFRPLSFWTSDTQRLTIDPFGKVGIGTTNPVSQLQVHDGGSGGINSEILNLKTSYSANGAKKALTWRDPASITGQIATYYDGTYTNMSFGHLYRSGYQTTDLMTLMGNGNLGIGMTTPTVPLQFGNATSFPFPIVGLYDGGSAIKYGLGISLSGGINGSGGLTAYAGDRGFVVRNDNITGTENFSVDHSGDTYIRGNVGIGTASPDAKLAVNGTIHTQEVKIDMNGWSDYVFEPSYDLPSLISVKTYIDKNHRLPEMPSTQEVLKNGINLGEIVNLQMKKIEELTLYLIKQKEDTDKQIQLQQDQINLLKRQLKFK